MTVEQKPFKTKGTMEQNESKSSRALSAGATSSVSSCAICEHLSQVSKNAGATNTRERFPQGRLKSGKRQQVTRAPSAIKSVVISETVKVASKESPTANNAIKPTNELVDAEVARRNAQAMDELSVDGYLDMEQVAALRGRTNTPASLYTDFTELRDLESRVSCQHSHAPSRDAVFQQAVTLMSQRCLSAVQQPPAPPDMPLVTNYEPPYGPYTPRYFYVNQRKPFPMPPLKAWRGYHGNVYFEPITVNQAQVSPVPPAVSTPSRIEMDRCSDKLQEILARSNKTSARSSNSYRSRASSSKHSERRTTRQMVVLDKKALLNNMSNNAQEQLNLIMEQESTGSLCITPVHRNKNKSAQAYNKDRIRKGSMAKSMASAKNGLPVPAVTGDRFTPILAESPLLRTQTQYSHSNQRMHMNSPSPEYYNNFSDVNINKLPALQGLRHSGMSPHRERPPQLVTAHERTKYEDPLNKKVKPFVKYSAEFRQHSNVQTLPDTRQRVM